MAAVLAYRNEDGGFGNALEPDCRIDWQAPSSTAAHEWRSIRTIQALQTLAAYGRVA